MIDKKINKFVDPYLSKISEILLKFDVSPNQITYCSLIFVPAITFLVAYEKTYYAIIFIMINRFFDGLDGNLARKKKPSKFGGYLDIIADYFFYVSVPLGFSLISNNNNLPTIILLISYIINLASVLGLAAINNFDENSLKKEKKSFFYSGGLIEGTETILFYLLICVFPDKYIILTYFFSILVFFTALIRLYLAKKLFK